jgi:hypothetical protein
MLTVLYLTHGFNPTTSIAVAGTLISLTITAVLSAAATAATHLSGVADETSNFLTITQGEVNMRGLLLAGIVIGSLGVLDDVTVTQSVTVTELAQANSGYGFRQLYRAATRIGRAHIASVINTIVLAYAGASLPLMHGPSDTYAARCARRRRDRFATGPGSRVVRLSCQVRALVRIQNRLEPRRTAGERSGYLGEQAAPLVASGLDV